MFYDNFMLLCEKSNIKPYTALKDIGIESKSILSRWRSGSTPRPATVELVAKYFGVTSEQMLFGIKKPPTGTDERSDAIAELNALYASLSDENKQIVLALAKSLQGK